MLTWSFPGVTEVKNLPVKAEDTRTCFPPLGQKDPLEEKMATHSSNLAWKTPRTEKPGGLRSMELQRVRHTWAHRYINCRQVN